MLDILLGLQKTADRIDWKTFRTFLKDLKAEKLFAAMLNTGIDYFHMDLGMVPEEFIQKKIRPEMMLDDMFAGEFTDMERIRNESYRAFLRWK